MRRSLPSLLAMTAFGIVAACASIESAKDRRVVCHGDLETLEFKIAKGVSRLEPWLASRGIASDTRSSVDGTPLDQESWLDWAQDRLKELQDRMDRVPTRGGGREIRAELSQSANWMVTFAGYAQKGRGDRMSRALETSHLHVWRARELACNIERF